MEEKGQENGLCNRGACLAPQAIYLHRMNGKYYCRHCAIKINRVNSDVNPPLFNIEFNSEV